MIMVINDPGKVTGSANSRLSAEWLEGSRDQTVAELQNVHCEIHKYKYTNTQIQVHKYKYTNANTQIQIHKCKYTSNTIHIGLLLTQIAMLFLFLHSTAPI